MDTAMGFITVLSPSLVALIGGYFAYKEVKTSNSMLRDKQDSADKKLDKLDNLEKANEDFKRETSTLTVAVYDIIRLQDAMCRTVEGMANAMQTNHVNGNVSEPLQDMKELRKEINDKRLKEYTDTIS